MPHLPRFLTDRLRRLVRDRRGTAAVEFGLVAPAFFGLVFATFDTGGVLVKSVLLDRALDKAIRAVRVEGTPNTQNAVKKAICDNTIAIADCMANMIVEMTVVNSTASFPTTSATCVSKDAPTPQANFSTGARGDVIYVRACLAVSPLTPWAAQGLSLPRNSSGGFQIVAIDGFMNEPGQ